MPQADRRQLLQFLPAACVAASGCANLGSERPPAATARLARVSTITTLPGRLAEAAALFKDAVLPVLQAQPGFAGAWLLTDEATRRGMTITLWAGEAELQGSEADARFRRQVQLLAGLLEAPPQRQDYVVMPLP